MRKTIIKGIILVIIFLIGIYYLTIVRGKKDVDQITTMSSPTLPTICLNSFDENMNELHGYTQEMQANYMRDTITPLSEDRTLPITINAYETDITKISYEVRSLDTTRLVEQTDVTDFKKNGNTVKAVLNIKNLLENDKEYILKIIISTKTTKNVNYYTRIIKNERFKAKEKIDFVKEFNQKTFDQEHSNDLVIYLESNSSGDNSNFNKVTIHSKFEQVTWGNLNVKQATTPIPDIKEIDNQTASIVLNYIVIIQNEDDVKEYYNVKEYYRVRYTKERNYLLDFERTMNQCFDEKNLVYKENRLTLGIRNEYVDYKENSSGNVVAFVQEGELYSINTNENKLIKVFSFKDNILDSRENYNKNDIKIMNVDNEGNISFIVYGYMNRGKREGQVGIEVLTYHSMVNTLEENVFIPSTKPFQILKKSMNDFVYRNDQNKMYIEVDDSLYCVDLIQRTYTEVVDNIMTNGFVISNDNSIIAWKNDEEAENATNITIMDLMNEQKNKVEVGDDERVMPIGFMDDDFIYGVAKTEDIMTDPTGAVLFPMYCIRIQNKEGELVEEYHREGIYIVDAQISDNVIKLSRATIDASGYTYVEDDSIMNSHEITEGKTRINSIITETKKAQIQLIFASSLNENSPSVVNPKRIMPKEDVTLTLKASKSKQDTQYYVYAKGELQGIYRNISEAVNKSNDMYGVVVDSNQKYIWERGNRLIRTTIRGITAYKDESGNSLATCLDTILELSGSNVDAATLMERGENAVSILKEHIDGRIIEFSNTPLSAVLYYVSKGEPVIAKLSDNSRILIIGYDELNISVMNPETGTIYKMGMNDSTKLFEDAGGMFITYIKNK